VTKAHKLRDEAFHARDLAWALTDEHARAALEDLACELERQALELERKTWFLSDAVSGSDT
jgi:hypothetical protein